MICAYEGCEGVNQFEPKTDKGTLHDYIASYYSNLFTPLKNNKIKIRYARRIRHKNTLNNWKEILPSNYRRYY